MTISPTARIEWFLAADGRSIQWGVLPDLWPRAVVARLPSWGWELQNPNGSAAGAPSGSATREGQESRVEVDGQQAQQAQQAAAVAAAHLWGGIIDGIVIRKTMVMTNHGHVQCRIELPQPYLDSVGCPPACQMACICDVKGKSPQQLLWKCKNLCRILSDKTLG